MKRILVLILLGAAWGYVSPQVAAGTDQKPTDDKVYEAKEVDSRIKILSKPEAEYTNEATEQHVVGVVRLSAVFTGSGEIRNIEVVNGLPAGLSEQAVAVARQITFSPAMKDGHPVSQRVMIVYTFEIARRIIHGQHFPKLFYDERCRDYSYISAENMVFFTGEKEAKKAGYKKSKTCPGGVIIP